LGAGEDRGSGEHLATNSSPKMLALQDLDREAAAAMTRRKFAQAVEKLRTGLEAAAELIRSGEVALGAAASRAFARRLGEALRKDGRAQEAIAVLRTALAH